MFVNSRTLCAASSMSVTDSWAPRGPAGGRGSVAVGGGTENIGVVRSYGTNVNARTTTLLLFGNVMLATVLALLRPKA